MFVSWGVATTGAWRTIRDLSDEINLTAVCSLGQHQPPLYGRDASQRIKYFTGVGEYFTIIVKYFLLTKVYFSCNI